MGLGDNNCVPCGGGVPRIEMSKVIELVVQLENEWELNADNHLEKTYAFNNFSDALAFVNKVGLIAEEEGHHPDIYLAWGKCKIEIWTHKIKGLTESDFYLAAKADRVFTSHV